MYAYHNTSGVFIPLLPLDFQSTIAMIVTESVKCVSSYNIT